MVQLPDEIDSRKGNLSDDSVCVLGSVIALGLIGGKLSENCS